MNPQERTEKLTEWYNKPEIKFNIIKFTQNRETSFLMPSYVSADMKRASTRMLKCHSVQHLDFLFELLKFFKKEKPYNLYYTIAKYKTGIPQQQLGYLKIRDNSYWTKSHYLEMVAYDYFIDIDSPSFDDMDYAYDSSKELKKLFDVLNVPYKIVFSGMGFHFKIDYKYLPKDLSLNPLEQNNLYKVLAECTEKLYELISEMIDTSIYDSRRLCKIPYTLSNYEEEIMVCCPINSDEEFNNFKLDNYKLENFKLNKFQDFTFNENGSFDNLLSYLKGKEDIKNETSTAR